MQHERPTNDTFEHVLERRLARRSFLKGAIAAAPLLAVTDGVFMTRGADAAAVDGLAFSPVRLDNGDEVLAAPGYTVQKFLRWGEPILNNAPSFDFFNQ
ncbi:MAG: PhoX family phosphatase, partial [Vicinamibacterales bacterium]